MTVAPARRRSPNCPSQTRGNLWRSQAARALAVAATLLAGCGRDESVIEVQLWHQMRPEDRAVLATRIDAFEQQHAGDKRRIVVRALYKETEELRSGLVSAMLADRGPEVIYGPSDAVGVYHAMGALADLSDAFSPAGRAEFDPRTLIEFPTGDAQHPSMLAFVGDRYGNHLALICNGNYVSDPPQTEAQLLQAAIDNTLRDNGVATRYGIVWNYTEPFFIIPFLTGHGAWVFGERPTPSATLPPTLDTPAMIAGLDFVADLRRKHNVLPLSADYEAASALFLEGKAAMIIDGDWSWNNYLSHKELKPQLVPLPTVESTGLPMAPMASAKGYSLSSFRKDEATKAAAIELIKFLTSEDTQLEFLKQQKILPSRIALRNDPLVTDDPVMAVSALQAERSRTMPADVEMRAVWDAMKPPYQRLLGGAIDAPEAARLMQEGAVDRIKVLSPEPAPPATRVWTYALAGATIVALLAWQRRHIAKFFRDVPRQRLAYAMALPSIALIALTVLFPLAYNVWLSFSNMSLTNLRDPEIIGLGNYQALAAGRDAAQFWSILVKTVFWTAVNVAFHVTIGVLLAVALNGPLRGKSIYRVLLIIPWAVPAYITALTWRGMFEYDFGAVNKLIRSLSWLNEFLPRFLQLEPVNWLGEAGPAFTACIIANVWLGFPFMMVIALGGLQGIPSELYEAARIDRASRWQQFRHITLPMLRPVLAPAVTLGAVWTFNNLNVVWLVSNTGEPADQTHILVSFVYKAVFNFYQYGYGAALSMVTFGILLAFSLLFLSRTRATEAAY